MRDISKHTDVQTNIHDRHSFIQTDWLIEDLSKNKIPKSTWSLDVFKQRYTVFKYSVEMYILSIKARDNICYIRNLQYTQINDFLQWCFALSQY